MKNLLNHILLEMETFLEKWTLYMEKAGYLEHTTAKREDCILSIQGVVYPVIEHIDNDVSLDFADILKNTRDIAKFVLMTASRHKARGIDAEMFFGCFKTLIHSVEDIIISYDMTAEEKLKNYIELRRVIDAMETIAINDWDNKSLNASLELLAGKNRELTLNKNKYENIFEATSDIVLVIDQTGEILELNTSAKGSFGDEAIGRSVLSFMGLDEYSVDQFLESFPYGQMHEIRMPDGRAIYSMVVVPLKKFLWRQLVMSLS